MTAIRFPLEKRGGTADLRRANAPLVAPVRSSLSPTQLREDLDGYLGTGRVRVSSEIVNLTIAEPFVELTSQPESIRRGSRKQYQERAA